MLEEKLTASLERKEALQRELTTNTLREEDLERRIRHLEDANLNNIEQFLRE